VKRTVILDTMGLNKRMSLLFDNLWDVAKVLRIKLVCPLKKLEDRIRKRPPQEGFFPYNYDGHAGLNKYLHKYLNALPSNITINTGKLSAAQTFKKAVTGLKRYGAVK
jgi:hypothetical protein